MEAYVAATAKLQQVSTGGDVKAINEATASFAKSCEDCHKPYRAPAQR
jgi:cytochrome c556